MSEVTQKVTHLSLAIYDMGAIRILVKHVQKKGNVYYYRRRIPTDVRSLYPGKKVQLFFSLKTSDEIEAAKKADRFARQQDSMWAAYRNGGVEYGPEAQSAALGMLGVHGLRPNQHEEYEKAGIEPDSFLSELIYLSDGDGEIVVDELPEHARLAADLFYGLKREVPFLTDALSLHQRLNGENDGSKESNARVRAVERFIEIAGNMPVDNYTRQHSRDFIQILLQEGKKTGTVKRYINYVGPIFSTAIREYELNRANIFENAVIPGKGEDSNKRLPFDPTELLAVQCYCFEKNDPLAWMLGILSDTGMRLAEIVGLRIQDIEVDGASPHLIVRPNKARKLKTPGSERKIPLVGAALWSVNRLLQSSTGPYLFPKYAKDGVCKSTSVSAVLAKRLRAMGMEKTCHSFRHSIRDRLRNAGAPAEVADRIGGWSLGGIGQTYGEGHDIKVLHDWMLKIEISEAKSLFEKLP